MGPMGATLLPAATMKLVGGDPCLDFVNTVGGRRPPRDEVRADKLAAYADLVTFAVRAGLVGEPAARRLLGTAEARPREAAAVLVRARAFREALYRTLQRLRAGRPPAAPDLGRLNAEIAAARRQEDLVAGREGLRWEWRQGAERLDAPLWPVARAAAALLVSPERSRLRRCGGPDCGWLFLDRSRNRTRQWCTMEDCGNLEKVRRFRRRHAGRRRPAAGRS
jgi:predicted RNA-binding Zn ribbon-like protein